jgi:exoribonuclease R
VPDTGIDSDSRHSGEPLVLVPDTRIDSESNLNKENSFFQSLIKSYLGNESDELISYFFKNKLEKEEYLNFLENLIIYGKKNFSFVEFLEELDEDINLIKQNNLNARFITDKWIIKLKIPLSSIPSP